MPGIIIQSSNFNGQSVQITFSPFSGGSINLGTQTIPYTYTTTNYEGDYSIYIPSSDKTCSLQVGTPPSPTPTTTPTNTPTNTPTQTPTQTPTITPTMTPTPSASAFDSDAAAFLQAVNTAGGTTDATISAATNTLFTDLKSNGLYDNLHFYPFIGGTAASHALYHNRVSGTTYDITWSGGVSHGISGSTGNGVNGYGAHALGRTTYSLLGDMIQGMYLVGENNALGGYELQGSTPDNNVLVARYSDGNAYVRYGASFISGANTGAIGLYISSLTGSTGGVVKLIKNGSTTLINTTTNDNDYVIETAQLMTGGGGASPGQEWSKRTFNFVVYGRYITDAQVSTLSTIINTFQTSLGRNVY